VSVVHELPSSQFGAAPPTQVPAEHRSFVVQASPSSQDPVLFMCTQPTAGSQESSVHGLSSSQPSAGPPTQVPFEHWSEVVHALPSSQPLLLKPVTWQMPAPSQVLLSVQTFPSSHAVSAGSN